MIGESHSGKSTLIDCMLGIKLFAGIPTNKIVRLELRNNVECDSPKFYVGKREATTSLSEAREAVREALSSKNSLSLDMTYESSKCFNLLLVDTPGLGQDMDELVFPECSGERVVLCVESTKRFDGVSCYPLVRSKLDPNLDRTFFVFTKFVHHLQLLLQPQDLEQFLMCCPAPEASFFVSLPNTEQEAPLAELLAKEQSKQKGVLSEFVVDTKWENHVSSSFMFGFFAKRVDKYYNEEVFARASIKLDAESSGLEEKISKAGKVVTDEDVRKCISSHFGRFVVTYCKAMEGSVEVVGTAAAADENRSWTRNDLDQTKADLKNIPFAKCKLQGGAQLQRVLNEFLAVVSRVETVEGTSSYAWEDSKNAVSSEMVYKSLTAMLDPALKEFAVRVLLIVESLCNTANAKTIRDSPDEAMLQHLNMGQLVRLPMTAFATSCCKNFHREAMVLLMGLEYHRVARDPSRDLNSMANELMKEFVLKDLRSDIKDLVHTHVLEPLTDANLVLQTLHTNYAIGSGTSIFNKESYNAQMRKEAQALKAEAEKIEDMKRLFK